MTTEEAKEQYKIFSNAGEWVKAVSCLEIAANAGDSDAQNMLGVIFDEGSDAFSGSRKNDKSCVPEDKKKSLYWYEMSARSGNRTGQHGAGMLYHSGEGIEKNYEKALYWLEKAALQGIVQAQHITGNCYLFGEGIKKDVTKACMWYEKAALQGFPPSQKVLDDFEEYCK
jgi:TPR repeat protein